MLRESSKAVGQDFDLSAIVGKNDAENGVAHSDVLLALVEAVLGTGEAEKTVARQNLRQAMGDAAFVDTCATIASFNAVVKLADGTGIPLEDYKEQNTRDIRAQLALDDFVT